MKFLHIITAPIVYPLKGICLFVKHLATGLGLLIASVGRGVWSLLGLLVRCIRIPFEVFWAILTWPFKAVIDRYWPTTIRFKIPPDIVDELPGKKCKK
jgi:hypothetical protein